MKNTTYHKFALRPIGILLILWMFSIVAGQAQELSFTAKASKTKLGVNQRLRVEFSMDKKGTNNFTPPAFKDFTVVAGPSSSVSQSWVNGVSSYKQTYTYIIEPKTEGNFHIAPAQVTYKGKTYESNGLDIQVTKAVDTPKDPNDPDYIASDEVFLVAHVSNTQPYIGEGIYVEYRLYFSGRIRLLDVDFGDMPKYEGFWNQDIDVKQDEKTGEYKGRTMHYYTLKKAILIPQKAGNLRIDPMSMDILLAIPTGRYDFFGTPLMRRLKKHYSSKVRIVKVRALPQANRPDNFTGAVGRYELSVKSGKNVMKTNEATTIKVTVQGKGNLKLFEMPKLNVPAELELYEPEHSQKVYPTVSGLKGSITDSYSIVPSRPGKYKIPPVSFSYFDPEDEKYHELHSEDIILQVSQGNSTTAAPVSPSPVQSVQSTGEIFRFISQKTHLKRLKNKRFFNTPLYYLLILLAIFSVPTGILLGKQKRKMLADKAGIKAREQDRLARKYLSEAEKNLGDPKAFYVALEKALHLFLKSKLHIETSQMSYSNVQKLLSEHQVSEHLIATVFNLLKQCELVRYASGSAHDTRRDYNKAKELIHKINQEFKS